MSRIRFYVNALKPRAASVREELAVVAARLGLEVVDGAPADVLVVLGGDGTLLRAVHEFPGLPVLGLNCGGLGYLASVEERDFSLALRMLATGRFRISERTALSVTKDGRSFPALNDVVVSREASGHAAALDLSVDGKCATRYRADGLIVATPTGSTAYSLSAGGPVVMPDSGAFVVTPMIPHSMAVRPLVVKDSSRLTVVSRPRANGQAERLCIYADGEDVLRIGEGESLEISKAERSVRLIELDGYDPYDVLARKLGWPKTEGTGK